MQLRPLVLVAIVACGVACGGSGGRPGNTGPTDLAGFAAPPLDFADRPVDMAGQAADDLASGGTQTCATATVVSDGAKLMAQDTAMGSEVLDDVCISNGYGTVLYYKATVPAGNKLTVTVKPDLDLDPVVRLLDACGATTCLASTDVGYAGDDETLSYNNTSASPRDLLIAVGGTSFSTTGTFALEVKIATPPPPAVNAQCGSAIVVAADATLAGQDLGGASESLASVCQASAKTGVLYYRVDVPANTKVEATVTPSGFDAVVRVLLACGATSCASSADNENANLAETVSYINSTAQAVPIIVAVGGYGSTNTGTFALTTKSTVLPAVPANIACSAPVPLVGGATLTDQTLNGAVQTLGSKCVSVATGPSVFYSATVPAGQHLVTQATPTGTAWDVVLRLLGACADTMCLGSIDEGDTGEAEVLSYRNTGGTVRPVVLAVGNYANSTLHAFDLSTFLGPLASNASCAQAIPLTDGTLRLAEDGEGATTALTNTCLPSAGGKVLYYSVTIPAGKSLKVRVTPLGKWDPVIRLLADCAATTCVASQDSGNSGQIETLNYANTTAAAQSFVVAVGGYATTTKPFHIEVGIF